MNDEYIITNQFGGYSSSTYKNGNTRKYHGTLIASDLEMERKVIISLIGENIIHQGTNTSLNTYHYLPNFTLKDENIVLKNTTITKSNVSFEYEYKWGSLTKIINLSQEENSVEIRYMLISDSEFNFEVSPFLANRNIHKLQKFNENQSFSATNYLNKYVVNLSDVEKLEILVMSFSANKLINLDYVVKCEQVVYKNIFYPIEKERGFEDNEDLMKLMTVSFAIKPGENYINLRFKYVNINIDNKPKVRDMLKTSPETCFFKNTSRINTLANFKEFLINRSEDFLIDFNRVKSIIAGFHWFNDWGRDTFISFRGLLLTTNKFDFAREVLNYWGSTIDKNGFIPNDLNAKSLNSIDSSLWYIIAVYYYYIHTNDIEFLKKIFPVVETIIKNYLDGDKDLSIKFSKEKFLIWDDKKLSLTWMDSMVEGKSTTNRIGAAVEIQFLWYNVYKIFSFFEKILKIKNKNIQLKNIFLSFKKSFRIQFFNNENNFLYDFIFEKEKSNDIRPNVIIGLSLPFPLLDSNQEKILLKTTEQKLLTELGLYTIDPDNPKFISGYSGNAIHRDNAYHNGTIWPFLLGMYLKSYLKTYKYSKESKDYVFQKLIEFSKALEKQGLKYIPELFAAGDKHPDGCITQAWNYATMLEVIYDFENNKTNVN